MFDDNNEDTVAEPNPFGARQRVVPGRRFKAVESAINELDPAQIVDERFILTQRVPKLPPPIPNIRRRHVTLTAQLPPPPSVVMAPMPRTSRAARALSRFALPVGGALVVALLSLYLALPKHPRTITARISPVAMDAETPMESFQLTASDDQPPVEPVK